MAAFGRLRGSAHVLSLRRQRVGGSGVLLTRRQRVGGCSADVLAPRRQQMGGCCRIALPGIEHGPHAYGWIAAVKKMCSSLLYCYFKTKGLQLIREKRELLS